MTTISPRLPPELMEEVVAQAWNSRLSKNERILLMTSLPLVSTGTFVSYLRISSTDVHIPCPSYIHHFMRLLRQEALYYPTKRSKSYPEELCRSITFEITQQTPPGRALHWSEEPPMGVALSDLLYHLRLFGGLPNLRRLFIRYIDVDLNDIFDWVRFIDFPKSVEYLDLEFIRREGEEPPPKIVITPPGYSPLISLWTLPFLLHLRVSGGNEEFVARVAAAAPNLRSIQHIA